MKKFTFLLFSAAFTSASGSYGAVGEPAPVKPTIVFVHGLWADGSCWSKVIPELVEQGYKVISVQNPTTSIEDDVAATKRAIDVAGGDVILVGHSWGGWVISEAGIDPRVKALVYVAAYAPEKGETVPSLSEKAAATQLGSYLQSVDGFVSLSKDGVTKVFADDLSAKEQEMVYAVQVPCSPNVFKAVSSNTAWKVKPSWYIVASGDHTINPDLERMMAERAKAKTTVVASSHVVMLSQPKKVLEVILEAVGQVK
ncbi:MAG: alpha/beta hydrolase [Bacteroidetes bacterium]|nr:alpha/beta hydrolase [Bacteroidota bacterium]